MLKIGFGWVLRISITMIFCSVKGGVWLQMPGHAEQHLQLLEVDLLSLNIKLLSQFIWSDDNIYDIKIRILRIPIYMTIFALLHLTICLKDNEPLLNIVLKTFLKRLSHPFPALSYTENGEFKEKLLFIRFWMLFCFRDILCSASLKIHMKILSFLDNFAF